MQTALGFCLLSLLMPRFLFGFYPKVHFWKQEERRHTKPVTEWLAVKGEKGCQRGRKQGKGRWTWGWGVGVLWHTGRAGMLSPSSSSWDAFQMLLPSAWRHRNTLRLLWDRAELSPYPSSVLPRVRIGLSSSEDEPLSSHGWAAVFKIQLKIQQRLAGWDV